MKIAYRQFQPSAPVAPYVQYFWTLGDEGELPEGGYFIHKCLPLGTAEIVFHLTDQPKSFKQADKWVELPDAYLVGVWTEKATVKITRGALSFGISIHPDALTRIFGTPIGELWNDCLDGRLVFGKGFGALTARIREAADDRERVRIAEAWLLGCLNRQAAQSDYVSEAARRLRHSGGTLSVDALSSEVFIGRRQLERSFKEFIGVSPKMFGRLARFSRAYSLVDHNPNASWAAISFDCGYADQAHFIRDFKAFTGEAPRAFFTDEACLATLPRLAALQESLASCKS